MLTRPGKNENRSKYEHVFCDFSNNQIQILGRTVLENLT